LLLHSARPKTRHLPLFSVRKIFVELIKLKDIIKKPVEQMLGIEMWAVYLEYVNKSRYSQLVEAVMKQREAIKMALPIPSCR
jgi:hypothetical protein